MFHKQNKMFVNYLNSTNPEIFKKLVLAVQSGDAFSSSFVRHFEMTPQEMWNRFKSELFKTETKENLVSYQYEKQNSEKEAGDLSRIHSQSDLYFSFFKTKTNNEK